MRARDRSTARVVQQLRSHGLRVDDRGTDTDSDCVAHSYGEVQQYFRRRPCTALFRVLLEVHDRQVAVLVAAAWVDMPDETQARELQQLVDRSGTGNLTELTKEGRAPTSTRWTGARYVSVRDGVTFLDAQAEPLGRTARARQLAELAASAAVH